MDEKLPLRPREKLLQFGAKALSDDELLAIFLRTGKPGVPVLLLAKQLLQHFGSLRALLKAELADFYTVGGIGPAKYAQLNAIAELSRRYHLSCSMERQALLSPQMTREFLQHQLAEEERETFMAIFLDNQNKIIRHSRMFTGTLTQVEVHPREIVREAMRLNAAAVIVAHNHPSGFAEPSKSDRLLTERIIKCCRLMDIRVLDHLVIGHGEVVSFAERGWI
ncbi:MULTISPECIES: RadC family protein [Tenebrionibacter/Tenebrionicola group]|jgi:DNA repair protein RadC|uniref:UPF0758 protein JJB97_13810 n=2 Tax=Tenebrionibacter/Tenebrionicola group TaxID=2969848 RepID=A0A8K0V8T5_9ENTR|nr:MULTISPECIES: DNA repair protein RadC [Tenebrionibacter/Tenebrionicola group]MBK4716382.1 DNA repair protein RadC [Tenebrionibacter intestinalis]MBV4414246.1 DNA repair protein RadC [Tenebrionicola larvae]MBV5096517.1 DNA repair protein RadC [Tenebrionicola larvae]